MRQQPAASGLGVRQAESQASRGSQWLVTWVERRVDDQPWGLPDC